MVLLSSSILRQLWWRHKRKLNAIRNDCMNFNRIIHSRERQAERCHKKYVYMDYNAVWIYLFAASVCVCMAFVCMYVCLCWSLLTVCDIQAWNIYKYTYTTYRCMCFVFFLFLATAFLCSNVKYYVKMSCFRTLNGFWMENKHTAVN